MKRNAKLIFVLLLIAALTFCMCSCDTIKSLLEDSNAIVGNDETTREARLEGAKGKATDALKTYTTNITMLGTASAAAPGTVFVIEVDDYYMVFKYEGSDFSTEENPDVLPMSDPYANRDGYRLITGDAIDNIPDYVTIYEPTN